MNNLSIPRPVVILDFGSQLTQNVARRVRELGIYSEIHPFSTSIDQVKEKAPLAIILSGGPSSVFEQDAPSINPDLFKLGIPVLGICYGMQIMAKTLGGKVVPADIREYGVTGFYREKTISPLWTVFPDGDPVLMSHGDSIIDLPPGFSGAGHTKTTPYAAMENPKAKLFGVQFHPEVTQTRSGIKFIQTFLKDIAGIEPNWSLTGYIDRKVEEIRNSVKKDSLICALSGGIDSTVTALLCHRAVGKQFTAVYVDNGLMRAGETQSIVRDLQSLKLPLVVSHSSELFLKRLAGVKDPERKRKIIGRTFIHVFQKEAKQLGMPKYLAQGTLYPDVIESVSSKGSSSVIKSHHNVGGLPKRMPFSLVEPLRELFKDEVRIIGKELGLPDHFVHRQPFPGPGLAIRILGSITTDRIRMVREADRIVREELDGTDTGQSLWQYFAVLLPVHSVGVMGDQRTYENAIAVRTVTSVDGMTADIGEIPHNVLIRISHRIISEVRGINRVVHDISPKPPSTIEWE